MIVAGGGTVVIDTTSARGAWATAIAHTPHLANQIARERIATPDARDGETGERPPNVAPVSPPDPERPA